MHACYYSESRAAPTERLFNKCSNTDSVAQGGHILPIPPAVFDAYNVENEGAKLVIVDPAGIIVNDGDQRPFGDDLIDYIRRLHTKFAAIH